MLDSLKPHIADVVGSAASKAARALVERVFEVERVLGTAEAGRFKPADVGAARPDRGSPGTGTASAGEGARADYDAMSKAPKDGTLVLLVVDARTQDLPHAMGGGPYVHTVGFNAAQRGGRDAWRVVAFDWRKDTYREYEVVPLAWSWIPQASGLGGCVP